MGYDIEGVIINLKDNGVFAPSGLGIETTRKRLF